MPARKKPEHMRETEVVQVRVTPALKAEIDAMANATGVPTSQRVRTHLEADVKRWRSSGA